MFDSVFLKLNLCIDNCLNSHWNLKWIFGLLEFDLEILEFVELEYVASVVGFLDAELTFRIVCFCALSSFGSEFMNFVENLI